MLLRAIFAVLLVLSPHGAHANFESSALTSDSQASDSNGALAASTRDTLAAGTDMAGARALLSKKKKKKPAKKPSPPPKRKPPPPPRKPSPKPAAPKPSPPKRSPSLSNTPTVVPSPPPSPSPSPSPSPPPPPACPLSIGGSTVNFQACDATTWPEIGTIYFSLEGETLTLGFRGAVSTQGWVGVSITPTFKMAGSDAVIAAGKSDGSVSPMTVHINGYSPATFEPTSVYSDVAVGKAGDVLAATAKVTWPADKAELALAFTAGGMSPTGFIQKHYTYPIVKKIGRATLTVV